MPDPAPSVLCRPYLVDLASFVDRLRAFGNEVRLAVESLSPEPLPSYERLAQQQFLECLDVMSWGPHSEAREAARALFDRLFWSWRGEELRIVEIEPIPFALDLAWSASTTRLFAALWSELNPVMDQLREPFDRALAAGELAGRFEDFVGYARAWGDILLRGAAGGQALIVVQFDA